MPEIKIYTQDIEIAVAKLFGYRSHLIVPNISWGLDFEHELDLLVLTPANFAWEVEIKVSASDLARDKKKVHAHIDRRNRIRRLYFALPIGLANSPNIPPRAGVIAVQVSDGKICARITRHAQTHADARPFTGAERMKLLELAAMRVWSLKEKLSGKRFEL